MRVIWSPSALREVARIFEYLQDLNPGAAAEVAAGLIAAGDSLADFADRGRPVPTTNTNRPKL